MGLLGYLFTFRKVFETVFLLDFIKIISPRIDVAQRLVPVLPPSGGVAEYTDPQGGFRGIISTFLNKFPF